MQLWNYKLKLGRSKFISTVVFLVEFPRVLLTVAGTSGQLIYLGFSPSLVAASGGYVW